MTKSQNLIEIFPNIRKCWKSVHCGGDWENKMALQSLHPLPAQPSHRLVSPFFAKLCFCFCIIKLSGNLLCCLTTIPIVSYTALTFKPEVGRLFVLLIVCQLLKLLNSLFPCSLFRFWRQQLHLPSLFNSLLTFKQSRWMPVNF